MSKSYHLKSLENGYGFIRLRLSGGFQQVNNLRCWRASRRRKAFVVRADEKLTAFVELEAAIRAATQIPW